MPAGPGFPLDPLMGTHLVSPGGPGTPLQPAGDRHGRGFFSSSSTEVYINIQ